MSRIFTFLFSSLLFISINAQVSKNYVVFEIATGTWCSYCPAAAIGADEMVENGYQVAIIENHGSDSYNYQGSNMRNAYYVNTSFPSTTFNGLNKYIGGGDASASNFDEYLIKYNEAITVMSDFTLELDVSNTSMGNTVTININEVGDFLGTNLSIHLIITESHIPESWEGLEELNFVNRAAFPDYNGTVFSGGSKNLSFVFDAEPEWVLEECEVIAFIQDNDTKEILQANKAPLLRVLNVNDFYNNTKIFSNSEKRILYIEGAEASNVYVYDSLGKILLSQENISISEQLDIKNLSRGVFLVKIINGKKNMTKKILIK